MKRLCVVFCLLVLWTLNGGSPVPSSRPILLVLADINGDDDDPQQNFKEHVQMQCGFTRYPTNCIETLLELSQAVGDKDGHHDIIFSLVQKIRDETFLFNPAASNRYPSFQLQRLNAHPDHEAHQSALGYCFELMDMSLKHLNQSLLALRDSPRRRKADIQTWLSAVLTFQHACRDSLKNTHYSYINNNHDQLSDDDDDDKNIIYSKMDHLSRVTSNSLALVNRITGVGGSRGSRSSSSSTRPSPSSEQVFPEWVYKKDRKLLQATTIRADAVVAQDGSGNYRTVSEAITAASGGRRFVIYVKAGVYNEKITCNKDGITMIGDGKYSTIISYHDSVSAGSSMPHTATFAITGDGFIARDIGFQNTAGPNAGQALAMNIASDHSVLYRCSIVGYQDTLYALALRQFYRECDIYGTIDFIFGNAAAVFQNCFLVLRRPKSGSYNVILANGRDDPGQNTGFSIQRCRITVSPDLSSSKHSVESYLGRPWKEYSRSVIMQTSIDDAIKARGWIEWSGNFALNTLYFAEYLNSGPGAGTSMRVKWPGYHIIGPEEAAMFTVGRFIGGTSWLPSTGVNFIAGLD